MEERSVPWWRRALSYALDGIRSGFGLFSRSAKSKAAIEPEIAAGNEENPDKEAELTSHSPKPEPIADAETEAEAVLVRTARLLRQRNPVAGDVRDAVAALRVGLGQPCG